MVHKDIKTSNIMLDSNFNAKLGNFGLARLVDHKLGSQTPRHCGHKEGVTTVDTTYGVAT